MNHPMKRAGQILRDVFGFDQFRPLQADIIEKVLSRGDSLVIMPTGGGKSLCYQIPALIFSGLTVVVSPLISLMKDQVEQLVQMGVPAAALNSSLSLEQYRFNVDQVRQRKIKLLYMAPEALLRPAIQDLLSSLTVDCLTIDEAHCISEWGHDFRPEYRQLIQVRERFPKAVCVALTATATPRVREDIKTSLGFRASDEFVASFDRKNLLMSVVFKEDPLEQTVRFINRFQGQSGIIYCLSRRQVDDLNGVLETRGFSVRPYHAGMSDRDRARNQELFIRDNVQIMVATVAFGMGIDKPNVRFVLHYDLPKNMEGYYQEIGRAGRDGLPAECLLLFSYGDIKKIRHFIDQKEKHEQRVAGIHLNALIGFAETEHCRRIPLLRYFGEEYTGENCGMCDNCLSDKKDLTNITVAAQKFMSCAKRTGERFGAGHIIDVLRGSQARKVLKFRHDRLSTYGIGGEFSKKQWFHLSRQLIQKGLMRQDMEFGGLSLTDGGWRVLRGEEKVLGRLQEKGAELDPEQAAGLDYNRDLFELLRGERKRLADESGVPPYVIFPDRSLMEMATYFPQSESHFLDIHGVGVVKHKKYARVFLPIIREYCEAHRIEEKPKGPTVARVKSPPSTAMKRHEVVGEAFNSGRSLRKIMEDFNIKQSTALGYLFRYWREGNSILESQDIISISTVSPNQRQYIFDRFKELGPVRLKPVFDSLDGEVSYDELRLLQIYYIGKKGLKGDLFTGVSAQGSVLREIVCLANSRKYSGRCVAGKEILGNRIGGWLRPVSREKTGELTIKETMYESGGSPRLLDIIAIPMAGLVPGSYQTENHLVAEGQWMKKGQLSPSLLQTLCDHADSLWINGHHSAGGLNDRMPEEMVRERVRSSLVFVKPDHLIISVEQGPDLLKKIRARFRLRGEEYWLPVTDPVVENRYLSKDTGQYPAHAKDIYLTVSIGEPFEGYCYKLVAGIINLL